jgi:hypothetical protein
MKRKLNEQWVKELDGKKHMLKAVEGENCACCAFGKMCQGSRLNNIHVCDRDDDCPLEYSNTVVKDLGILNEHGCLPSPWGGYPTIIHEVDQTRTKNGDDVHYDNLWCVEIHELVLVCTDEYPTEQEAIDAWNRRK